MNSNTIKQSLLFSLSTTLERTAFYGVRVLLTLYLIGSAFEMTRGDAISIYGWFTALIVLAKIIGALLGDFVIGNKKSIIIGGIFQAIGAFLLCIPLIYGLYAGLFFIVLGGGLYSPNLIANFGKLYSNQTKLLDSKFTLLYLFTNIGIFIGTLVIGFLADKYSFMLGFILAGILFLFSAISIIRTSKEQNTFPEKTSNSNNNKLIYVGIVFLLVAFFWALHHISSIGFYDIDIEFKQNLSTDISKKLLSQIDLIFFIPISLILYFIWNKYHYNQLYKIASAFIFGAFSFLIISLIQQDPNQNNVSMYLAFLFFLCLAEVHIAPIIHSTLTQYSNPKYLATFISLSFIPTFIPTMLIMVAVSAFNDSFYENNLLALNTSLIGMAILGIVVLVSLYVYKIRK